MTAQLWLGSESAISHSSAAALWGFPSCEAGPIELSSPRPKRPLPPVVVHSCGADLGAHTTTVGPLRVTNPGRTLVDIAGDVSSEVLERCLEDALRRRLTSVRHVEWLLGDRYGKGAKGASRLRKLVRHTGPVTESDFELKLLQAIRRASLPLPERQHVILDDEGRFVGRVDFAYLWAKVAIEADGYEFHSGRQAWEEDLSRRNALTALGWLVLHVSYRQLHQNPLGVIARIKNALEPPLKLRKR